MSLLYMRIFYFGLGIPILCVLGLSFVAVTYSAARYNFGGGLAPFCTCNPDSIISHTFLMFVVVSHINTPS